VTLLDTHVLLWLVLGDARLGRRASAAVRAAERTRTLAVSAISFWEIEMLGQRRRVEVEDTLGLRRAVLGAGVRELPIDGEVALAAAGLPGLHRDPANRFIAASAVMHDATLVTANARLLDWRESLRRIDARA